MKNDIKEAVKKLIALGHEATAFLDNPFVRYEIGTKWPPVFIIGTPRSGSTLLYQMLMHRFEFAYFPNVANFFYMCPVFVTRLARQVLPPYQSRFTSRYGFESGWLSPSEAGNVWNRWFPHEKREGYNYTPSGYLTNDMIEIIRSMTGSLCDEFNAPFLIKNLKMSVRIQAIHDIFSNALFIYITRDLVESALSILIMRRREQKIWRSVIPKEVELSRQMPELEQVASQMFYIEQDIRRDILVFDKQNCMEIDYIDVCRQPEKIIERVSKFLLSHNVPVRSRISRPFTRFPVSSSVGSKFVSPADVAGVKEELKKLFRQMSGKGAI